MDHYFQGPKVLAQNFQGHIFCYYELEKILPAKFTI